MPKKKEPSPSEEEPKEQVEKPVEDEIEPVEPEPEPMEPEPETVELEPEPTEVEGHLCPKCGEVQDHFIDPHKHGWVRCPNCGKHIRAKEVPDHLIIEEEPKSEPEPKKRGRKATVPEEDHDDEYTPHTDGEEEEPLFRTRTPPHDLLEKVLRDYAVKNVAVKRIVGRCERLGQDMHPSELQGMLLDLNSGLKAREVKYCVDEYVDALDSEDTRMAEINSGRSGSYRPRRRSEQSADTSFSGRGRSRSREGWTGTPWDRRGGTEPETFTKKEVFDLIEKRDRERDRDRLVREKDEEVLKLRELTAKLEQKLEDFEENPPSAMSEDTLTKADLAEAKSSDYIKALELQLQMQSDERKREADERREEMRRYREEQKEAQAKFETQTLRLQDKLEVQRDKTEDERRRGVAARSSEGYKSDEVRIAAEGMQKLAEVIEKRESPIKALGKIIPQLQSIMTPGQAVPPPRERGGPSSVADLVAEQDPNLVG